MTDAKIETVALESLSDYRTCQKEAMRKQILLTAKATGHNDIWYAVFEKEFPDFAKEFLK
jgi:hypothetical protein